MQRCSQCKETKPLENFAWKNKALGILARCCRACTREYCKAHYRKNSVKHNQRRYANQLSYKERNRDYVVLHLLTHPCVDCGESDPVVLDFDHVRGSKYCAVSRLISAGFPISRLQAEMDKCVVRCSNCHRRKTSRELAWFKNRRALRVEADRLVEQNPELPLT
jgi:hypothetical protein